jgi:hypothetical protein
MFKRYVSKMLFFASVCVLAVSMGASVPQAWAGEAYVCQQGSLHLVKDLKGGDLPSHQTKSNPPYTCYAASMPTCGGAPLKPGGVCRKPGNSNPNQASNYSCQSGSLHLVKDLKGGVQARHQTGSNPPYTCIAGSLPTNTCTGNDAALGNPPVCKPCNNCNGDYLFCTGTFANSSHTACFTPTCPAGTVLTPFNLSGKCVQCTGNTYSSVDPNNGVPQCLGCPSGWSPNSDHRCCGPQGACIVPSGGNRGAAEAGCSCSSSGCPSVCTN